MRSGSVEASIGFPGGRAPEAELIAAAGHGQKRSDLSGLGSCCTASVPLEDCPGGTLLLARVGDDAFGPEELNLLRAMARVLELALRMLRTSRRSEACAGGPRSMRPSAAAPSDVWPRSMPCPGARRLGHRGGCLHAGAGNSAGELDCASGAVWLTNQETQRLDCAGVWAQSLAGFERPPAATQLRARRGPGRKSLD